MSENDTKIYKNNIFGPISETFLKHFLKPSDIWTRDLLK